MATKNLARTIIEGGRRRYNKAERRHSNRSVRRRARQFTHALRFDPEGGDGRVGPRRDKVYRGHDDKLAAISRWLASFAGQPWDDVRSEIARRFDTGTIAGQHIIHDHLLPSVRVGEDHSRWWRYRFYVDDEGVLREDLDARRRRRRARLPAGKIRRSMRALRAWAADRRVGRRGAAWFWYDPTGYRTVLCSDRWCDRPHRRDPWTGARVHRAPVSNYRQGRRLTADELAYWHTIPSDGQASLAFARGDAASRRAT